MLVWRLLGAAVVAGVALVGAAGGGSICAEGLQLPGAVDAAMGQWSKHLGGLPQPHHPSPSLCPSAAALTTLRDNIESAAHVLPEFRNKFRPLKTADTDRRLCIGKQLDLSISCARWP